MGMQWCLVGLGFSVLGFTVEMNAALEQLNCSRIDTSNRLVLTAKTIVEFHPLFILYSSHGSYNLTSASWVVEEQIPFRPHYDRTEHKLLHKKMFLNTATTVKLIKHTHIQVRVCMWQVLQISRFIVHALV